MKIQINPCLFINEEEIGEKFIRSSGPGGQKVNKTSTAVQLSFNINANKTLPTEVKAKLFKIAKNRINERGILIIKAMRYSTRQKNREDALKRLVKIIEKAAFEDIERIPTNPSLSSREKRLKEKKKRSEIKKLRQKDASILNE